MFAVWLAIIGAESLHGALRILLLAPVIGDFRARQIGVVTGAAIVFLVTWLLIRWLRVHSTRVLLAIGGLWVVLTVTFEVCLGRLFGTSWNRILSDYDLPHGGFLGLGLLAMLVTPLIATRLRGEPGSVG